MSATGRGSKRQASDLYPTPEPAFKPLLPFVKGAPGVVWEPACGDGRLVKWMLDYHIPASGADLAQGVDFLKDSKPRDTVLTNPPFSLALEFIEHAMRVTRNGEVWMLLRLNFLGAKKRKTFWQHHEPDALFVLSDRPKFINNKADACEYAWFYWGRRHRGTFHP